ncbi:hypothetical protein D3C71_2136980 [compost metagenome]
MQLQPRAYMRKTGLDHRIGTDHFFDHTGDAITFAIDKLDVNKCLGCKHFAFRECAALSSSKDGSKVITYIDKSRSVDL